MATIKAYVTNLGLYNEGYLVGEWVTFPITADEQDELMERIKIDETHEEYFMTDFDSEFDLYHMFGEYVSIETLNDIAEQLDGLSDYEEEIITALIGNGYSFDDAMNRKDDVYFFSGCSTMAEVAEQYAEETGLLDSIPENLRYYFDFEAYGRDMSFDGEFIFTDNGNCIEVI